MAIATGDVARYLAILTDDAVYLPPDAEAKEGAELRAWLEDFLGSFHIDWLQFVHGHTVIVGDMAHHRFSYTWKVTPRAGGAPAVACGKGIQVLRRQADGSWKLARSIWERHTAKT